MVDNKTIKLHIKTKKLLDDVKIYKRETYNDIILRLLVKGGYYNGIKKEEETRRV